MQKMGDTIITDLGMDLLSSVNNGDDKITYTKTVLAADDLTQESDVDIQKTTSLKLIQQTTGTTVISRVDNTVNLGATFTNKEVTQNFDFYVIGWYAKGSAVITDERLFAITPSTVKQTMPAGKDGAATAAISPKYASALSRSATVSLNPDQAGTVTPEYVDQKIQQIISEGIVNAGSTLSESDNLDSFITTGYHLIKGSLPLNAPEGFSTNGQIIVYGNKDTTDGVTQLAYDDINGTVYVRSYNPTNNKWAEWDLVITKSQLNAVLPTDIARTGENNDFKGKNTFETDPTDGAGNAYAKTIDVNQQLDKKVNIADMRKPANDVAGIEEVNAKQDKIGYTPADDSKVVHTADTSNWQKQAMFNPGDFKIDITSPTTDFATLLRTNYDKPGIVYIRDGFGWPVTNAVVICEGAGWWYAYGVNSDGNFVHRRIRASDDTGWIINADDSRVAHLSGANNFDTVPTVNNNPLLLASSLPSDLARTGQDQEFTGKNTFDTAPIDKTTGNPYITKDSVPAVPSTLADTTKDANFIGKLQKSGIDVATTSDVSKAVNTATANMANTTKLANFTAGLQVNG
ncbi:pyocin knob domain-containing protein, partial [Lentilactobacillus sunkii]|uniref:pyocin knob domain-containing protein n=1 Tax=Lentilactobacillus sunkii TaxID=481719 RepID=UPI000ACF3210